MTTVSLTLEEVEFMRWRQVDSQHALAQSCHWAFFLAEHFKHGPVLLRRRRFPAFPAVPTGDAVRMLMERVPPHPNVDHPLLVSYVKCDRTSVELTVHHHYDGPDLFDHIVTTFPQLTAKHIHHLFRQLVAGVAHLHRHGLAHNDVSLENAVLADKGQRVVLIDHDMITRAGPSNDGHARGKASYMAPEMFATPDTVRRHLQHRQTLDEMQFDLRQTYDGVKADVFALGVCLYYMCFAVVPYRRPGDVFYWHKLNGNTSHYADVCKHSSPHLFRTNGMAPLLALFPRLLCCTERRFRDAQELLEHLDAVK